MAKGDADKAQNTIDTQGKTQQANLNNLMTNNQTQQQGFQNFYNQTAPMNLNNYNQVQSSYDNFLQGMPNQSNLYSTFLGSKYAPQGSPQGGQQSGGFDTSSYNPNDPNSVDAYIAYMQKQPGVNPSVINDPGYWRSKMLASTNAGGLGPDASYVAGKMMTPEGAPAGGGAFNPGGFQDPHRAAAIDQAIDTYGNFAQTGGFSPEDIANIRARSVAPIRSMAQTNTDAINRQNAIRGTAYSPNTAAAIAKVARDANYAAGDTAQNAEANLAQLTQQGKLYGAGGLASTGLADQGNITQNRLADLANATQNRGLDLSAIGQSGQQQLGALQGKTNLYGTTPGLTNMFGNQALTSSGQGIQVGGLQNQMANDIMQAQIQKGQIPGNFQSAMGNIASLFNLGGAGSNALSNLFKGGNQSFGSGNGGTFNGPSTVNDNTFGDGNDPFVDYNGGYGPTPGDPSNGTGYGPGMQNFYNPTPNPFGNQTPTNGSNYQTGYNDPFFGY